jgi:hypothetical protein
MPDLLSSAEDVRFAVRARPQPWMLVRNGNKITNEKCPLLAEDTRFDDAMGLEGIIYATFINRGTL